MSTSTEIDFIELLQILYKKKLVIILSILLGLSIGLTYLFYSKPLYEAKVRISAASAGDIAVLNQGRTWGRSSLKPVTVRDVYLFLADRLSSEALKQDFFKQFYMASLPASQKQKHSEAQLYASFIKNFSVTVIPLSPSERFAKYTIAVRGNNPQQVSNELTQFLSLVNQQVSTVLLHDLQQQNAVLITNLEQKIAIARRTAKMQREDRVKQLQEKIRMAQVASAKTRFWDDEIDIGGGGGEIYPLNLAMAQAELKNLSSRKSNDAFTPRLRELQAELEFYKSLVLRPEEVKVFHLDGVLDTPASLIGPKKKLVLMVSLVSGLLFGILLVMGQFTWSRRLFS